MCRHAYDERGPTGTASAVRPDLPLPGAAWRLAAPCARQASLLVPTITAGLESSLPHIGHSPSSAFSMSLDPHYAAPRFA